MSAGSEAFDGRLSVGAANHRNASLGAILHLHSIGEDGVSLRVKLDRVSATFT
jgi:hypothetical protein